ncbi:MAG TPA: phage tail protein [Myxococcales bacterium]|jgi:phage tail-like protein
MADKDLRYPLTAFNFGVEITMPGAASPLVGASFSECDGLEMTMEVKTIREGGNNSRQIRLTGPLAYGQLVLKRGMTRDRSLWDWFDNVMIDPTIRATAEVVMFAQLEGALQPTARFILSSCLPVKLKAPALNAKDGIVAIEELQVAYEQLSLKKPPEPETES